MCACAQGVLGGAAVSAASRHVRIMDVTDKLILGYF